MLHGGIVAALLGESMAWAMWAADRALGVTAKMETRYRRPIGVEGTLTVRGRVVRMCPPHRGRRDCGRPGRGAPRGGGGALPPPPPAEEARMASALGWDVLPG